MSEPMSDVRLECLETWARCPRSLSGMRVEEAARAFGELCAEVRRLRAALPRPETPAGLLAADLLDHYRAQTPDQQRMNRDAIGAIFAAFCRSRPDRDAFKAHTSRLVLDGGMLFDAIVYLSPGARDG